MKTFPLFLGVCAISCGLSPMARAQWSSEVTGVDNDPAHDYNNTANWTGATINDTFAPTPNFDSATTLYFSADRATTGDLSFQNGGNGVLTLQGNGTDRTLTLGGNIIVNTGNLSGGANLGNTGAGNALNVDLGGVPRTFDVSSGRALVLNNTVSNGSINVTGGGRVTLAGTANSFAGGVNVLNGTLTSSGNTVGSYFGSGTITLGDTSGSADASLGHLGGSTTIANNIVVAAGSSGVVSIAPSSGNNTYSGTIALNRDLRLANSSNGTMSLSNTISGTGDLLIQASNNSSTTLGGAQDFTGAILNTSTLSGSMTATVNITGTIGSSVTGITQDSNAVMVLSGNSASYAGGVTITSGIVRHQSNNNAAGTGAISIASGGTFQVNGTTVANAITGTGAVSNLNGSNITLSGDLSGFTGSYNVAQPTPGGNKMVLRSSTAAASTVNIDSGATLFVDNNANVASSISMIGTGNTENRGALRVNGGATVSGAVTLTGNASTGGNGTISGAIGDGGNAFSLTSASTSGAGTILLTGNNTYTGGTIVTSGSNGGIGFATGATGTFGAGDVTVQTGGRLTIGNFDSISNTGMLTVFDGSFVVLGTTAGFETIGALYDASSDFFLPANTYTASELNSFFATSVFSGPGSLIVTAVPEPSTWGMLILGGGGMAALAWTRRRKGRAM